MFKLNIFKSKKKDSNLKEKNTIQTYIDDLNETLKEYENRQIKIMTKSEAVSAKSQMILLITTDNTKTNVLDAISETKKRIVTLNKILKNEAISKEDHQQLLLMEVFENDKITKNYSNFIKQNFNKEF